MNRANFAAMLTLATIAPSPASSAETVLVPEPERDITKSAEWMGRDMSSSVAPADVTSTHDAAPAPSSRRGEGHGLRMLALAGRYDRHHIAADHVTVSDRSKMAPNDRNPVRAAGRARKKRRGF